MKALQFAAKVRNAIVHHEFKVDPAELKPAFARLFGFLVDFHRDHCDFALDDQVSKSLWLDGVKIKEYGEELFLRAQARMKSDQVEENVITCPKCGWRAISRLGDRAERCYVCQNVTSLDVCARCDSTVLSTDVVEHGDKKLCYKCFEFVTTDYWHDSAKENES